MKRTTEVLAPGPLKEHRRHQSPETAQKKGLPACSLTRLPAGSSFFFHEPELSFINGEAESCCGSVEIKRNVLPISDPDPNRRDNMGVQRIENEPAKLVLEREAGCQVGCRKAIKNP